MSLGAFVAKQSPLVKDYSLTEKITSGSALAMTLNYLSFHLRPRLNFCLSFRQEAIGRYLRQFLTFAHELPLTGCKHSGDLVELIILERQMFNS